MDRYGYILYYRIAHSSDIPYIDRIIKAYEGLGSLSVLDENRFSVLTTAGNLEEILGIMEELEGRMEIECLGQFRENMPGIQNLVR